MPDFVELMEGVPINISVESDRMEMYWYSNEWILEPAAGRRVQCLIDSRTSFSTKTKTGTIELNVPHIIDDLQQIPKNTLLDGFITDDNSQFVVSDVIFWNDNSLAENSLFDRKIQLKTIVQTKNVRLSQTFFDLKHDNYEKLKDTYDTFYFKNLDSPYHFGRSRTWRIFKEPKSFFVVIMGVTEGKGKIKNMCGAFQIGQYKDNQLTHITNVSGMSNEDRVRFYQQREQLINKVIEIKAFSRTKTSFDEARFYRLRDDIDPKSCIFQEGDSDVSKSRITSAS